MTKPIARDPIYRRRRFEPEIIELCVRWYLTYRLSYRDLVEMMAERTSPGTTQMFRAAWCHVSWCGVRDALIAAIRLLAVPEAKAVL
jgi:hypothetical protein